MRLATSPDEARGPESEPIGVPRILGLGSRNPVWVASGPMTDSEAQIRRALAAGAGGVVTKTIYRGPSAGLREKVLRRPWGFLNSTTYSRRSPEEWKETLPRLAAEELPVAVSIHAPTATQLGDLAAELRDAGAAAFELGIACPNDGAQQGLSSARVAELTAAVVRRVDVAVSVKLAAVDDYVAQAFAAWNAGAVAITLSDTLPGLDIDPDDGTLRLGGEIGYSGPGIRPLVLRAVRRLREAGFSGALFGVGGIETADHALQYLWAGATATQLYSALITNGLPLLTTIRGELRSQAADAPSDHPLAVGRKELSCAV